MTSAVEMLLEFSSERCLNVRKENILYSVGTYQWDRFG
jgi:hypothetical protein